MKEYVTMNISSITCKVGYISAKLTLVKR